MTSPKSQSKAQSTPQLASALTPFRQSRIYAEGWNAARKSSEGSGAARNPYPADPERARWAEGFAGALA
jgi:hypothetical protein